MMEEVQDNNNKETEPFRICIIPQCKDFESIYRDVIIDFFDNIVASVSSKYETYQDANEAIKAVRTNHYDIVIIDHHLTPEIDALVIAKEIRMKYQDTAIIIFSGSLSVYFLLKCFKLKITRVFPAPFEIEEFISELKDIIKNSRYFAD